MGVDGQLHSPAALRRERDPVPIVKEAGWAPGPLSSPFAYVFALFQHFKKDDVGSTYSTQ